MFSLPDSDFNDTNEARSSDSSSGPSRNGPVDSTESDDPLSALGREIAELLAQGQKIQAIKRYRQATGVGLREAKDAIDALQRKHGLSQGSGCAGLLLCGVAIGAVLVIAVT